MTINDREYIYVERYRPKKLQDIILPKNLKKDIQKWIDDKEIPNLLLTSKTPGLGKSSLAHVIINELNAEALFINASLESNIDTLRYNINGFVRTSSISNKPKIVVLDEFDNANPNSTQPALRAFIEEYSKNARFILTCNYREKILNPIINRMIEIDFDVIFKKNKELIKDIYLYCKEILNDKNIEYNDDNLKYIIKHYYPSIRGIVMKLQELSTTGKLIIKKNSLENYDYIVNSIISNIKKKDFEETKKYISTLGDPSNLYTSLYDNLSVFDKDKQPQIILIIGKYQANDHAVRDKIINVVAMCTEIMLSI